MKKALAEKFKWFLERFLSMHGYFFETMNTASWGVPPDGLF